MSVEFLPSCCNLPQPLSAVYISKFAIIASARTYSSQPLCRRPSPHWRS